MFWLNYECFSILCNAFLLKCAISSHNSCDISDWTQWEKQTSNLFTWVLFKQKNKVIAKVVGTFHKFWGWGGNRNLQWATLLHFRTPPPFLFYWWFWCRISCWLRIILKLGSENQQKWSHSLPNFWKILISHHEEMRLEHYHSLAKLKNKKATK